MNYRIEEGVRSKLNDVVLVKRSVLQRLVHDFKQQNANLQMATKKIEDQDRKYKSAMDQMQELGRKIKELDHDKDTLKRRVYALSDDLYDERQENQKLRSESARRY
jgi:septal ring factor EnvC (AmiA/AmiB activator)